VERDSVPLNEAQKGRYRERRTQLGCPVGHDEEGGRHPRSHQGPLRLSSHARESSILPHFIEVHDLEELKDLVGVQDARFTTAAPEAPWTPREEWPAGREVSNFASITPAEARRIANAGRAYVLGPSRRAASYRKTFERLHMPFVLIAFSLPDVIVTPEHPLILTGEHPVVANFGTVTIVDGGQILVQTEANITIQVLRKVPARP
jgi:hypothetical protein